MPVEFLSDREVAGYGRYVGAPSPAELDRFFFLDDADKALIGRRRGAHHRLGFALQLATVRFVGMFLPDPLDVPDEVVIYLAKQLDIDSFDQLTRYTERRGTRFEHQEEIRAARGLKDFSAQVEGFTAWLDGLAFATGDGPHALFAASVDYLHGHYIVLPGVSTLARLVARVREEATSRLYRSLCQDLTAAQCVGERGKPWEASYECGWSVNSVLVSCSLSTRMRISIAASGPRPPALTPQLSTASHGLPRSPS